MSDEPESRPRRARVALRSPKVVMTTVGFLVLSVIAKLAFLESMPVAPVLFFATVLLVQYLAQLVVDLRAFADAKGGTPPVTYAVTFALVSVLAVATELFRAARADYSQTLGVFLAMTLAASLFLLLVVWWDWAKRAFSSLKMAVTLLSLIGVGSIVGTFVIQHMPEESVAAHRDKFMNGEGAAPVNARYLFQDPEVEWTVADEARQRSMNAKFGPGQGDRWKKIVVHERVKATKREEAKRWVDAHKDGLQRFYEVCERTQASRIFKSWYFNALLVLLASTVVGVMVRRFPYEPRDAGWVAAHAGIVFLLVCLALSDLFVRDGFVQLAPTARPGDSGAPTDARSFDDLLAKNESRDLGWTLRLVRTSADWYQSLFVAFVDDAVGAQEEYPVLAGRTIELERPTKDAPPKYRIEILESLDRCRASNVGFKEGEGGGVAAVPLDVREGDSSFEQWLVADSPPSPLPGGRIRLIVAKSKDDEDRAAKPTMPADTGDAGVLRVVVENKTIVRVPATAGASAEFEQNGRRWRLAVADASLDAKLYLGERSRPVGERTPIERQAPDVGVAFVSVEADGFPAQRAVAFGGENAELGNTQMANAALQKEGFRFYLDFFVPTELRLVARADGSLVLVEERRGVVAAARPLAPGDALPHAAGGPSIVVGALLRNAEESFDVVPLPAETDADYMKNGLRGINEQQGVPAVRVRVKEPDAAPYERWILGADPWGRPMIVETRDRRVRMTLRPTQESMFRSAVQALDSKGRVLGEHVVRVNAPFRMRGHEFYQNQFIRPDQGGPISVFRVKYDPLVPFLYVGFVAVAAGVIAMLWLPRQRAFKLHAHLARLPEEGPKP